MAKFYNRTLSHATNQARRLLRDNMGNTAPGVGISLTGLGFAGLACLLFLDAGFNIQSSSFGSDLVKALTIF